MEIGFCSVSGRSSSAIAYNNYYTGMHGLFYAWSSHSYIVLCHGSYSVLLLAIATCTGMHACVISWPGLYNNSNLHSAWLQVHVDYVVGLHVNLLLFSMHIWFSSGYRLRSD